MTATVPVYTKSDTSWVPTGAQKTTKLALIGLHCVGSALGHPEMIWATFEHFGVAANDQYTYNSTSGPATVPLSTAGSWLLTQPNANSGPFNEAHMDALTNPPNITAINGFKITPSSTLRRKAFGAAANVAPNPLVSAAASNTEIISINNSVLSKIPAGDVRKNYYMVGSTWTINGAAPNGSFNGGSGNEVGTSRLNNASMETYDQGPDKNWAATANCFTCHTTNTTAVSLVYAGLKPLF